MSEKGRLCILFFYDRDSHADRYVSYYLEGLKKVCDRVLVVSNGEPDAESAAMFRREADELLVRENKGFDVWAYKEALEHVGWDELERWQEVVLCNCTLMGPVYDLSEMFGKMAEQPELDFWGLSTFDELEGDPFGFSPYGYLPQHIQSHFIVYRSRFLKAPQLRQYWADMPEINSYEESIGLYESVFTKHFADLGFRWDTYIHTPEDGELTTYYLMMAPVRAVRDDRCPFFKRRSFFQPLQHYIAESAGEQPWELFRYLRDCTDYDTGMILENLIRTCHADDIVRTLRMNYVLPSDEVIAPDESGFRVAAVMHLYYMDLLGESVHYASALPPEADICITTGDEANVPAIREAFSVLPNKLDVRVIVNRGRDVSSLLVGAADLQERYDLICFYHDKKTKQVSPYTIGQSFAYKVEESVLASPAYVRNLIDLFRKHPRLGMLSATPPNHANFRNTLCLEWGPNFEMAKELAGELGIRVPMSAEHPPVAPLGTVFWYRTKALAPLFARGWTYEDFPPEPNGIDGTILHAIERLYPFAVQAAGYIPARCMPDRVASMEIENLSYYVRMYNGLLYSNRIYGSFDEALMEANKRFQLYDRSALTFTTKFRLRMKKRIPRKLYKTIVVTKRKIFGPHGIPFDVAELGDPD